MTKAANLDYPFYEHIVDISAEYLSGSFHLISEWLEARNLYLRRDYIWMNVDGTPKRFAFKHQQDAMMFKLVFG